MRRSTEAWGGWAHDEIVSARLPDKRLARRLRRLLDQMSAAPGQPVPAACGDWAAAKAAYRFFEPPPPVTEYGVLAGHFAATAARCAASEGPILILQDTTEFIFSRAQPCKIGFTKTINAGRHKGSEQERCEIVRGLYQPKTATADLTMMPPSYPESLGEAHRGHALVRLQHQPWPSSRHAKEAWWSGAACVSSP